MPKKLEIGIVKKQDILENQVKKVILSLGSNLGNRTLNLEKTKFLLENNKIKILKCSKYYESFSWPNKNFPKFYNIVIEVETYLKPLPLLILLKNIEKKMGRTKTKKNYPRICDIDIIDYDAQILEFNSKFNDLKIPHKALKNRPFVLIPLFEISKNWVHPISGENICNLLNKINADDLRSIKLV